MRISEIANQTGCTVEMIRFYENKGLVPRPPRTSSNYRIYSPEHLARLLFIRHCRSLDLSLEEIKKLVSLLYDPKPEELIHAHEMVEDHLKSIDSKIDDLNKLKAQLNKLHEQCHHEDHEHGHCGLIEGLKVRC